MFEKLKTIIMACSCYLPEKREWLNKCGTEHCPLRMGKFGANGSHVDSFKVDEKEDEE